MAKCKQKTHSSSSKVFKKKKNGTLTYMKSGSNHKVTLEVNTDYIKLHKNKFSIVEHMLLETEDKIKEISENYGLQELMLHVVKMKLVIQNS